MLVTFHSKDHYPITMFGEPALQLIQLMGAQPKVPGAFYADDVPQALWQLQEALEDVADAPMPQQSGEEQAVSLKQRAMPLLDMLKAAVKAQHSIHWD
ncbi:MAG: DUF1840 domain-containing protein [Rheinheimera sp.]|nr:DUF1840 domain-containing protein [Rheinheimera sp.]